MVRLLYDFEGTMLLYGMAGDGVCDRGNKEIDSINLSVVQYMLFQENR